MKKLLLLMVLLCVNAYAVDSTVLNTQANFDMTYSDEQTNTTNYGTADAAALDDNYYETHLFLRITDLDDELTSGSAGRDYDSAIVFCSVSTNSLDDVPEELTVSGWQNTRAWVEGEMTHDIYSTGNSWTVAGGDKGTQFTNFGATGTMVLNFATGLARYRLYVDTGYVRYMIETDNTLGFFYTAAHTSGSPNDPFGFWSEDATPASRRPYMTVYYTTKAGGAVLVPRRRNNIMNGGN